MSDEETPNGKKRRLKKRITAYRKEGYTFKKIAEMLNVDEDTLSGEGEWHAQTVHRLAKTDMRRL